MKKFRYTDSQILSILKQAEAVTIARCLDRHVAVLAFQAFR